MKKALLVSVLLFITSIAVLAYETVIIKFPEGDVWHKAHYQKAGLESILQYVPKGQTKRNWNRTIIIHAYNESKYPITVFMANNLAAMSKMNPTSPYRYLRLNDLDALAYRCTKNYKNIHSQCEFFRATRAHNGIISIHYINKDEDDFKKNYQQWFDIIRKAKFLNTYWRNDRILNKSEYYELW
ncbi:hypothetical protein IJ384_06465 [bacterium]|nr:hypothetical protein [bacterium]